MIDNAVPSVPASMNDENQHEGEVREAGRRGAIIILFNPLKVETHQSDLLAQMTGVQPL